MFLLRRIVGPIATGAAAAVPEGDHTAEAMAGLEKTWQRGVAEVEVVPGSDAATRLGNLRGSRLVGDRITLHYVDVNIMADELAGFGPEVLVLSPPELRDAVIARLTRTSADHGGAQHG